MAPVGGGGGFIDQPAIGWYGPLGGAAAFRRATSSGGTNPTVGGPAAADGGGYGEPSGAAGGGAGWGAGRGGSTGAGRGAIGGAECGGAGRASDGVTTVAPTVGAGGTGSAGESADVASAEEFTEVDSMDAAAVDSSRDVAESGRVPDVAAGVEATNSVSGCGSWVMSSVFVSSDDRSGSDKAKPFHSTTAYGTRAGAIRPNRRCLHHRVDPARARLLCSTPRTQQRFS